ncbi:MAG: hypothetical protein R6V15_07830 [Desulfotignum sp.]
MSQETPIARKQYFTPFNVITGIILVIGFVLTQTCDHSHCR